MERFAFKIDKVLRANLYKICRLCGIDNPDKVPILRENETEIVDVDAEPELSQKIRDCIGFLISKDDKMPQMICSLCVDKINDFYEFREMCYATNIQTRKLLGIKDAPKKNVEIKAEVKTETPTVERVEKRGRKRKMDDINFETDIKIETEKQNFSFNSSLSKKKVRLGFAKPKNQITEFEHVKTEVKNEPPVDMFHIAAEQDMNLKQICKICKQRFASKYKLNRHKFLEHTPNVPRFICITCDETLKMNGEIKSHQLWHKLSKTPYTCALCRETMSSVNLYTRHLRDHMQKLSTPLVVLDRECALCHVTFCTNFLYNTHPCAVRTQKCGGCNRQIKNEVEYLRHASMCDKAYLMTSKHLTAALEPVQIKNENDVEAAAESFGISASVAVPDISMTQNAIENSTISVTDTLINKSTKKGGKKGISKKDLKRVDDLLKSTMDALVSIKHEPEMHVDSDVPNSTEQHSKCSASQNENVTPPPFDDDDFHNRDDDSDDEDAGPFVPIVEMQTGSEIVIKQEPIDSGDQETVNTMNEVNVTIKKELPDSGYEDSSATGSVAKIPVLKLKITKEHGTLNSSIVDENLTCREKKKKKKKRKDVDKVNEQTENNEIPQENSSNTSGISTKLSELSAMPQPGILHIKQERIDDDYHDDNLAQGTHDHSFEYNTGESVQAEATVMTSIPMMQLQIACVSSGVAFNEVDAEKEELQDVKPNRAELDRWLQNNSNLRSSTILEGISQERNVNTETNMSNMPKPPLSRSQHIKKTSCRSKAIKSTGGISRQNISGQEMPKIIAITSGFNAIANHNEESENSTSFVMPNVSIKPEPCDDGYENVSHIQEVMNSEHEMESSLPSEDSHQNSSKDDIDNHEQAYINSIDFTNISIKQEKDIDVSEPQLTAQQFSTHLYNGAEDVTMESMSDSNKDIEQEICTESSVRKANEDAEDENEIDDEEEDMELGEEDNSDREYRELEWPPPLTEPKTEVTETTPEPLGLVITSVCSQANEILEKSLKSVDRTHTNEKLINNQESKENSDGGIVTESNKLKQSEAICGSNSVVTDALTSSDTHVALEKDEDFVEEISNKSRETSPNANTVDEMLTKKSVNVAINSDLEIAEDSYTLLERSSQPKSVDYESTDTTENAVSTMTFKVVENANNLLEANPSFNSGNNENTQVTPIIEHIDEEQQNILNQSVLANNEMQANNRTSQIDTLGRYRDSTSSSLSLEQPLEEKSTSSTVLTECNEETDNFFNENVDANDQRRQHEQDALHCMPASFNLSQQRALLIDNSNINEIAENNNNANIERELLDDTSNNTGRTSSPSTVDQVTNNNEVT